MTSSQTPQEKRQAFVWAAQEQMEYFFSLVAIFVIPALFFSSIILAASVTGYIDETGTLGGALVWLGGMVLTISIEAASIGSFNLAHQMKERGQGRRAWWVSLMGIVLTTLVIITLAFAAFHITSKLTIFGITSRWDDVLKIVRIAAAVLYALFAHSHGGSQDALTQEQQDKLTAMLDQFRQELLAHLDTQMTERPREVTGHRTTRIVAPTGQAQADRTRSQTGQETPDSGQSVTSGQDEASTLERPDKLTLTLQFLQEYPDTNAPDYDERLATHLNLRRAASARFWKLKAQELLHMENTRESNEPGALNEDWQEPESKDNERRIDAYLAVHPGAKQVEIASALGISDRTVRRYFAKKRTADRSEDEDSEDGHGGLRVVQ